MRDLRESLAAYTSALNNYELDIVAEMFAADAVYISPGVGGRLEGRVAIMAAFNNYFAVHVDQVNEDIDIVQIDERTVQSKWRLNSALSKRQGEQTVVFDAQGQIALIEVRGNV